MGTTFTILFTFFVIRKGMKKGIAKVSNIFVPLFIITLLSISFFILFKNFQGIKSDFKKTDFKKLEEITVWKDAFGQAFFLLSTTTGTIIIYSSHAENKKNNNKKATIIIIATIIICFLIGNIVNNLIGEIATKNKEIKIKGGSKLLFETIPFFFLSGSGEGEKILLKVTGFTFFILVFFIGFTSIIGQIESLVNGIKEKFNFTRFKSLVISCFFVFLVSFIYYKDEKIIKFTADWVASTWLLLLTVFELFIVFRNKKQYYQFKHWINKHDKFKLNKIVEVWIFLVVPYIASVNFLFSYKQITQNFNEDPVIFLVITFFSVIVPVILALLLSKSSKQEHQKSNLLSN